MWLGGEYAGHVASAGRTRREGAHLGDVPAQDKERLTVDTVKRIVSAIGSRSFRYSNEAELQDGLAEVFREEGIKFEREKDLGDAGRIDFLVEGDVGLEVKVKGSPSKVAIQLLGYAGRPELSALILVTGRSRLAVGFPNEMSGKPFVAIPLWKGAL